MLKAAIFDFDGLLLDTETVEYESWSEIFAEYGAELTSAEWGQFVGTWVDFRALAILERRLGRSLDQEALWHRHRGIFLAKVKHAELCPGAEALVADLREAGIRLAIASNSDRKWVHDHLAERNFRHPFEFVSTGDDVDNLKPAPDIYLRTLDLLGISAHEAVVFEDSVPGVTAAQRAGIKVFAVPTPITRQLEYPPVPRLHSLAEMSARRLREIWRNESEAR